jgi:hypothetical protein
VAGYIFGLNNIDSLRYCIENGVYSTNLSSPSNNNWRIHHEGTFADYISMKPGDNVYFFIDRKIYGIGKFASIQSDCKYQNYPQALVPNIQDYNIIKNSMLINEDSSCINNRLVCIFEPYPNFFMNGIDMDEVLSSNPNSFKMLRAFWKLSFVKVDDEENKALKDIVLKRNQQYINNNDETFTFNDSKHHLIKNMIGNNYLVTSKDTLKFSSRNDYIKHEMAIEAGIIDTLASGHYSIFGNWDYVSHQVIASPFKPIDYMDKLDIFGYRYIPGFDTISKYLLIEIKKDNASIDAIDQIMKYVDWINQEYSHGDYSTIEAFLVAYDFPQDVIDYKNNVCIRNYTRGRRPTIPDTWTNVRLIKYIYDSANEKLVFIEI